MKGVNKVILVGNVGREPEIKTFDNGKVASVSLGTNSVRKKAQAASSGSVVVEWHRLVFYNELADIVQKYVNKGKKLYIEGYLRTRKYMDRNNQQQHSTEIVVTELQFFNGDMANRFPEENFHNGNVEPDMFEDVPFPPETSQSKNVSDDPPY